MLIRMLAKIPITSLVLIMLVLLPCFVDTSTAEANGSDDNKVGLLLVFSQRARNVHGGDPAAPRASSETYKTVWITAEGSAVNYMEKQGFAIAPGTNGFYKIERIQGMRRNQETGLWVEVDKIVTYRVGSDRQSQVDVKDYERFLYSSEAFFIDFIGEKYMAIVHARVYTTGAGGYQYHPRNRFHKLGYNPKAVMENTDEPDGRISVREILPSELNAEIDSQISSYRNAHDKTVKVESDHDTQYISENDMTLRRDGGRWKLFVPVKFSNWKYSHNRFVSMQEIKCHLPHDLVAHNELVIPFDEVKRIIPDMVDAASSPDNSMLVIQTADRLKIYINPLKGIDKPVFEIPISGNEKIILNQWAAGQNVDIWDKEMSRLLK